MAMGYCNGNGRCKNDHNTTESRYAILKKYNIDSDNNDSRTKRARWSWAVFSEYGIFRCSYRICMVNLSNDFNCLQHSVAVSFSKPNGTQNVAYHIFPLSLAPCVFCLILVHLPHLLVSKRNVYHSTRLRCSSNAHRYLHKFLFWSFG